MKAKAVLETLKIKPINAGACDGLGEWLLRKDQTLLSSVDPSNEAVIAKVYYCSEQAYEHVIESAKITSQQWRTIPAPKRGELIRQLGNILREHKDALGSLVAMEMGKSKAEGDGEVQEMIDIADFAVGQSRMLYGLTMHSEREQHRMYEQWHPLGVVGVISAFNFPVAVWAWNACIAAICGNTVVWKPSSKTPLTAIAVQHLCNQAMEQSGYVGVFSLLIGEQSCAEKLVDDERVALISFTGSTAVGREVAVRVQKRFGKVLLELGGNNAIIVDETANLSLAVPAIVFGAVGTAGQRCTTTRRLLVHQSIVEPLTERLVAAYRQVTIGDPQDSRYLMGPLIDHDAVMQYEEAIKSLREMGAEILYGGQVLDKKGYFVEPTLVYAQNSWPIVQKETFSPILYMMTYNSLEEAIALNNDVEQGLSSAIFTDRLQHAEQFLSHGGSDCGIANVNIGTSGAEIGGAFGGEKHTGGGREAGSDAWRAYMRRQTNTINWGRALPLAQGIQFQLDEAE
jgi:aldehyde dehydrogenase (NAD+)